MKIDVAKTIVRAFDNSGGVIRSDNLHALADAYEEALAQLATAANQAEALALSESAAVERQIQADSEAQSWQQRATLAESRASALGAKLDAEAAQFQAELESARRELGEALEAAAEAARAAGNEKTRAAAAELVSVNLRDALKAKMDEYRPHDPGFCAACDLARAALAQRVGP